MKNPHLRAPALLLALLLMLTLAACGGDDTETMAPVEPDKLPGQEEAQEEEAEAQTELHQAPQAVKTTPEQTANQIHQSLQSIRSIMP